MEDPAPVLLLPGDSLPYQVSTGDRVNMRNDTGDAMVIVVRGKSSGTVVRVQLPPDVEISVIAGLEHIDITLGDEKERSPERLTH
jgi:hypothetical protein